MALHLAAGFSSALVATPQSSALRRRLHILVNLLIAPANYTRATTRATIRATTRATARVLTSIYPILYFNKVVQLRTVEQYNDMNSAPTAKACYPTRAAPPARSCAARTSSRST